ncbi:MAG TPA: hypothetical protein EYP41_03085 [Anaerolineae bacterium]|nr:hypothetical protein [Anaerolineae bacterium]
MSAQTLTLELPDEIYQQAKRIARQHKQSVEQVVIEWIRPPAYSMPTSATAENLADLSDEQLLEIARMKLPPEYAARLQELLIIQQERDLMPQEMDEATDLLAEEDAITLKKARALFLLQQRGVWSGDLEEVLG